MDPQGSFIILIPTCPVWILSHLLRVPSKSTLLSPLCILTYPPSTLLISVNTAFQFSIPEVITFNHQIYSCLHILYWDFPLEIPSVASEYILACNQAFDTNLEDIPYQVNLFTCNYFRPVFPSNTPPIPFYTPSLLHPYLISHPSLILWEYTSKQASNPDTSSLFTASGDKLVKFWQTVASLTDLVTSGPKSTLLTSAPILSITLQAKDGTAFTSDSNGVLMSKSQGMDPQFLPGGAIHLSLINADRRAYKSGVPCNSSTSRCLLCYR
jgi:hypothetical protein